MQLLIHAALVFLQVLCSDSYYARLARLAGKSPKSIPSGKTGGRHFDAIYESCFQALPRRLLQIRENCSSAFESIEADAAACLEQEEREGTSVRLDGKKAVYKNTKKAAMSGACGTAVDTTKAAQARSNVTLEAKEVDPWKLRESKEDHTKMKCPPLELFHWHRIVVDEFTYLLDKPDRQRPLSMVQRGLRADFRWILSGTPRHESFDDIKCLANLMNVHIGIDETMPGSKVGKSVRGNEKTAAECMAQFLEVKSIHWHNRRRGIGKSIFCHMQFQARKFWLTNLLFMALAQSFLDRFVRQNVAEIDEIPSEEAIVVVDPTSLERYRLLCSYYASL
jgi:SNF2-related domain